MDFGTVKAESNFLDQSLVTSTLHYIGQIRNKKCKVLYLNEVHLQYLNCVLHQTLGQDRIAAMEVNAESNNEARPSRLQSKTV